MAQHVVIAGGGFGGYYAAKTLERTTPPRTSVSRSINDVNYMLYAPLLPGAAAGTLEARHIVVPLRQRLKRTELRLGWVTGGDPAASKLCARLLDGQEVDFVYDQLVVALGSVSRTFPIPGLHEHAIGFKTISEASALRNRVVRCLETAEEIEDEDTRRQYLGFVFVGGGYAGARGRRRAAGFLRGRARLLPALPPDGTALDPRRGERPDHAGDPAAARRVRAAGAGEARDRGADRRPSSARSPTARSRCRPARSFPAGPCAGPPVSRPTRSPSTLGLPLTGGRIACTSEMRVTGYDNVWALGDIAAIPDPARPGEPSPPTAQHAIRQGKLMGKNVAAVLGHVAAGQAVHVQDARGVRRPRPPQRRRQPDGHARAGLSRLGDLPLLPPRLDARFRPEDPADQPTGRSTSGSGVTPPSSGSSAVRRRSPST